MIENSKNSAIVVTDENIGWYKRGLIRIVDGCEPKTCSILEAYEIAKNLGLDLVIIKSGIFEKNIPGIAKIMDYNKFVYNQKKKNKENDKKQKAMIQKIKEVKFHIGIDVGDYSYKLNHIQEFLNEGDKVNCQVVLRGREKFNDKMINDFVDKLKEDLEKFANIIKPLNKQGNIISCILVKKIEK